MTGSAIAQRYARAVFGLAQTPQERERLRSEADMLTDEILDSEALRAVLFTPLHPRSERRGVIGELAERLALSPELRAFARLLVDENRTQLLPAVRDELRELVDRAAGRLDAQVVSARELSAQEQERLREALSRRFDAQVTLDFEIDASLIGGLIARVGNHLLDASIRTQLADLGANLKKGSLQ